MDHKCVFDMDNISHIKVLSREEERELLRMAIERGDMKARNKIVEHNLRLVAYVAKSYARNENVFSELYAEGYTVLFHAIDRFDLSKETKFSTYATWWLRQSMSKYLQNRRSDGEIHDLEMEHKGSDSFERSEVIKLIRDCLYILTDREADIIKRRFGIGCEEETLDQIGTDYGLSKERIRQVQEKAMEKMQPLLRSCM
jgi:RNA polymerase sigma factor (sigma-70 family)